MADKNTLEMIQRRRMHGLFLTRNCPDIVTLAHELMGLHSWFYRNVPISGVIRGADITGWNTSLIKTWLYRGTLHGVAFEDLSQLLALHTGDTYLERYFGSEMVTTIAEEVERYMEDGVYSRAEFRKIFMERFDANIIEAMFSPWGGVFVHLARSGRVAFRDMTSRDFELIYADVLPREEVLNDVIRRFFTVYGPATTDDAAWFLGLWKSDQIPPAALDGLEAFKLGRKTYYHTGDIETADIPEVKLLSGFDPLIVSYTDRSAVMPEEHKSKVVLKSGICNPMVLVNGRVAGIWNIKKNEPVVEFFEPQPKRITDTADDLADMIRWRVRL